MRTIVYSLRTVSDKTILSIDLGGKIVYEDLQVVRMVFNGKEYTFWKGQYINSMKVIEIDGHFFMLCNKYPQRAFVYNKLIEYQISKMETTIDRILMLKKKLQREMVAA
jgi:hypothetical protein